MIYFDTTTRVQKLGGFYDASHKVRCIKHLDVLAVGSKEHIYCYEYTLRSNG